MGTPRSIFIDRHTANRPLLDVVQKAFQLSRKNALAALREQQIRISGNVCADPARRVKLGQHIQLDSSPVQRQRASDDAQHIAIRHVDEHLLVVEKPAGMTTVRHADEVDSLGKRAKRFLPPTLVDLLPAVLAQAGHKQKGRIRAVHRLDKETSGLLVLARTADAETHLGKQFRAHTIGRRYLALVRGVAKEARIESLLVADRGDGRRGSGPDGQRAVTHVRIVESLGDFTLVECELETGRTHQVRIHLGEAGTPLCGERVYDRPVHGKPISDASGAKRPMLHAVLLALDHPETGKRMEWESKAPRDMSELIKKMRDS